MASTSALAVLAFSPPGSLNFAQFGLDGSAFAKAPARAVREVKAALVALENRVGEEVRAQVPAQVPAAAPVGR